MADPVYGPTLAAEIADAGLQHLQIWWSPYEMFGRENLTTGDNAALDAVLAVHVPTEQRLSQVTPDEFIARFTNAEYRAATATTWRQTGGNGKDWDVVVFTGSVDFNKKKTQTLKTNLVAGGILTQARADAIFL
jgi:hypothetical protein